MNFTTTPGFFLQLFALQTFARLRPSDLQTLTFRLWPSDLDLDIQTLGLLGLGFAGGPWQLRGEPNDVFSACAVSAFLDVTGLHRCFEVATSCLEGLSKTLSISELNTKIILSTKPELSQGF